MFRVKKIIIRIRNIIYFLSEEVKGYNYGTLNMQIEVLNLCMHDLESL